MRENLASWGQRVVVTLAILLVVAFFLFGMPRPEPGEQGPDILPTPQVDKAPAEEPEPGVPAKPVSEHETWPDEEWDSPDRQLDAEASDPLAGTSEAPSEDLTGYWDQEIDWKPCHGEDLCAQILVPLDWEDPGEAALTIAVRKIPSKTEAGDPVFVNPGGPGVGGQSFAGWLGDDPWPGHDVIGWDPRGTGESTSIGCSSPEDIDRIYDVNAMPANADERDQLVEAWSDFALDCREESGDLLDHVTSIEVVRDLDLLRHLVGAEKLNFLGVSYGTYLGSVYAELFPERAGRMVLVSAVDITGDSMEVTQAEGFERALDTYLEWCAADDRCSLGDSVAEAKEAVVGLLERLAASPAQVGERKFTAAMAETGIRYFFYADEEAYEALTFTLTDAVQGRYSSLLEAFDELGGRGEHFGASYAMYCADWPDKGIASGFERWEEQSDKAPIMGKFAGVELGCEVWTSEPAPRLKLTGDGAPPIVVVGLTGDAATPYEHSQSMAKQLSSGVLVTREGLGHGYSDARNECIDSAIDGYLLDDKVPEDGLVCS